MNSRFLSDTIPSTPYAVSIFSLSKKLYFSPSPTHLINRKTPMATNTSNTVIPTPAAIFSDIPNNPLSLNPERTINRTSDMIHKDTPSAILGAFRFWISRNSTASSMLTLRLFSFSSTDSIISSDVFPSISSFNK